MRQASWTILGDRGVEPVTGAEAETFLDNLVTNDVTSMTNGEGRFAALLTPQGKILFDFFICSNPMRETFFLEVARDKAAELVKRLALYKLRAKVEIENYSDQLTVAALWAAQTEPIADGLVAFHDPRLESLGYRILVKSDRAEDLLPPLGTAVTPADYHAHRIAHGIPEGGKDFPFGDTFPHEANMDRLNGVSFTKGCFIGQEVVARMQHKTVVRKRIVRVTGDAPLAMGTEVRIGEATLGAIGSVAGTAALAMLRLDRVIEALDKGQPITASGQPITVDPEALQLFADETTRKATEKANRI